MHSKDAVSVIQSGNADAVFSRLYPADTLDRQKRRYQALISDFCALYGEGRDIRIYAVCGRTELSGNHTDHNRGTVLCGAVHLDILACVARREDGIIRIKSEGFPEDTVCLHRTLSPDPARFGKSEALIAGVAAGFTERGFRVGGFDAYTVSDIPKGSGLSSSAAFEDMVGTILSDLYNDGSADKLTLAKISQEAENRFFGKPCGLMDQIGCICGGVVSVDFKDPQKPEVTPLDFSEISKTYDLCAVNTGGSHADLTADYAAIPAEMKKVAAFFGKEVLREIPEPDFAVRIPALRGACGDRAVLRAMHFYAENRRVSAQMRALREHHTDAYLRLVLESGRSSCQYLQNAFSVHAASEQGVVLALCLCDEYISGLEKPAAFRLHGGGFAGTVQAYIPKENTKEFIRRMSAVFGTDSVTVLAISPCGASRIF